MTTSNGPLRTGTATVEQIPVTWALPEDATRERRLVIWLAPGLSGMEVVRPVRERLAALLGGGRVVVRRHRRGGGRTGSAHRLRGGHRGHARLEAPGHARRRCTRGRG